jgi:hypothetical protein
MTLKIQCLLSFLGILFLAGCIEPYSPNLHGEEEDTYVISGEVTNQEGYQLVTISKAAPIDKPVHIPVTGGVLSIEDDLGHVFGMEEFSAGQYRAWIDKPFLHAGASYRLHVLLQNGEEILSDYDRMHECPDIDSVYYKRVSMISPVTGENVEAVQFYADFHGSENNSRFYRLSALETWEHHSPWPIQYYYNGKVNKVSPPDYSLSVCWITESFPQVYTLSTENMVSNDYIMLPINYVDNTTTKLYIGYSVLITLHALSEPAYNYWEQLRINNDHKGGLYEKQPLPVTGNLRNLTDPARKVLGYFEASGTSGKRIFIDGIRDMGIYYDSICSPYPLGRMGWKEYPSSTWPVYLVMYKHVRLIVDPNCVDCRYYGGVLEKPEFWPK